jgi:uncharacterized protein
MNHKHLLTLSSLLVTASFSTPAQNVEVSRENKTAAVTITKSIEVQPEFGMVQIGYHNEGRTQDSVYEENGRQAQKIIAALLAAGVKKSDIQTESVDLSPVGDSSRGEKQDKERRYEATQSWRIRAPIGEVQKVVDQAVTAGANNVSEIIWAVNDLDALDAQARREAVTKARALAEEMAQSLGGKVGGLLYVSNSESPGGYFQFGRNGGRFANGNMQTVEVTAAKLPLLNLFPQKVRREVTIYAVFALE